MALLTSLSVIRRSISLMEDTHSLRMLRTHCVTLASWDPIQFPSHPPLLHGIDCASLVQSLLSGLDTQ